MSRPEKRKRSSQEETGENKFQKTASDPPEVNVTLLKTEELPNKSEELDDRRLPIDFLLLTVNKWEFLGCLSYMKPGFSRCHHNDLGRVYLGYMGEAKVAVMKCRKGSSGPLSSSGVVRDAVKGLRPKAVFCVGSCGGLNKIKINLGDVVVSEKLITYAPSKVNQDGIEERGERVSCKTRLMQLILDVDAGWKAPLKDPSEREIKIHSGALLSGPEVVNSNERRIALIERFKDGIGIEMEGEGVYAASKDLDVEWIIIKGVSDYADGKKSETDSWRQFASLMAASLTAHIFSDPIAFRDWPHYGSGNTTTPSLSGTSVKDPCSAGKGKEGPPRPDSSPKPTKAAARVVKEGSPSCDELEELSNSLGTSWESLARRLGFHDGEITGFHKNNEEYAKKAYKMLLEWKDRKGSDATYEALYQALCHQRCQRKRLAEEFCCTLE